MKRKVNKRGIIIITCMVIAVCLLLLSIPVYDMVFEKKNSCVDKPEVTLTPVPTQEIVVIPTPTSTPILIPVSTPTPTPIVVEKPKDPYLSIKEDISNQYGTSVKNVRTVEKVKISKTYWITGAVHYYSVFYEYVEKNSLFEFGGKMRISDDLYFLKFDSCRENVFYPNAYDSVKTVCNLPTGVFFEVSYEADQKNYRVLLVDEETFNKLF